MTTYQYILKILALGIFAVALIHILLGVSAEPLLGSGISEASQSDPSLDSQNRFYGAAFALFGVIFWLSSTDLGKYREVLIAAFAVFFLAGLVRLVSIVAVGLPSLEIMVLTTIEICGPPVMYLWLSRILQHRD